MTAALDNNATRNALINAIKKHIDPSKPEKVNIKKYVVKQYKPEDPTGQDKLASFAWALYHNNRTMRDRDHVFELFGLLGLDATGLEQRKTNSTKGSPLKEAAFDVFKYIAGQDTLMLVALNEVKNEAKLKTILNWKALLAQVQEKRTELEAIADTVYELAGVSPGAIEDLDAAIVKLHNEVQDTDITSIDWTNRAWWDWANTALLEQVGTAA